MAQSAEMLWIDALELDQAGDIQEALELARQIVEIDSRHSDAWMMIARLSLPPLNRGKQVMPTLAQAATSLSALRRVVQHDHDNKEAWILGGALLVDHLGMMEESLVWWEQRRDVEPREVMPLIEQIGVLIRLGIYKDAGERLEEMFSDEMEPPDNKELMGMDKVRSLVENAAKMEKDDVFRPANHKHKRWAVIDRMKTRKPVSPTLFLFTFVAPIVFLLGTVAMTLVGGSLFGFVLVFFIILGLFMVVSKFATSLLHKLNRHALDLDRALDVEMSTGKVCIPDDIRGSKLYNAMLAQRPPAFVERLEKIAEVGERLSYRWKPDLPNWMFLADADYEDEIDESEEDGPLELDGIED